MSSDLTIRLDADLPAMAVDVVAPDFQVVRRLMLSPGLPATVTVPSEQSFLRLHHPSGEMVVLTDPGSLERVVTAAAFAPPARTTVEQAAAEPAPLPSPPPAPRRTPPANASFTLSGGGRPTLSPASIIALVAQGLGHLGSIVGTLASARHRRRQEPTAGAAAPAPLPTIRGELRVTLEGELVTIPIGLAESVTHDWQPLPAAPPGDLVVELESGARLAMRLPAATRACRVEVRLDDGEPTVVVRLRTNDPVADAILNYLRRGDVTAAAAMEEWAESSHEMLMHKMSDPYAAAVGAYLLLRLHRFDLLHDWPRNLANHFDYLPDGCVIWAWQLINQDPSRRAEIIEYLDLAVSRGVPVYTPGLRLALDALSLLGDDGRDTLAALQAKVGTVLWESPLTTSVSLPRGSAAVRFDVGFEAR